MEHNAVLNLFMVRFTFFLCLFKQCLSLFGPFNFFNILKGPVILSAFSVHMHVWQYMFEPSPFVFTAQTLQAR